MDPRKCGRTRDKRGKRDAVLGVFCRRFGVPLVDMGTIRLPRLIGHGRAMDLILTGRPVPGPEALEMGLVSRLVEPGGALDAALRLARDLVELPNLHAQRPALHHSAVDLSIEEAIDNEIRLGWETIRSGETMRGAKLFQEGYGRHGAKVGE